MLIEFIGAAGAGKSFHAERLQNALLARGIPAHEFDLIPIKRTSIANMLVMTEAALLARSTRPPTWSVYVHNCKDFGRYAIRRKLSEEISGIHITSEGLFHRFIMMSRRSKGARVPQIATTVFQAIQPPDFVVAIEVDAATIHERRTVRNRPGDVFTMDSICADIDMLNETMEAVLAVQMRIRRDMRLVRCDASKAWDDSISKEIAEIVQAKYLEV